jgi:Tripartite tricarboxylate transporter family receptor
VPFAAGGPTDVVARIIGERMATSLGQPVMIENVTGADGVLGVGRVVRAPPDGYTISIGNLGTHVLNGAAYALPYALLKDLEPVALISSNPYVLIAKKSVPASNLDELVSWIKANPGKLSIGVASMTQRVSAAYFQKMTGTKLLFVPYRGSGPALQDMLAGQVDLLFDQPTNFLSQVNAGNAKAFAVAADAPMQLWLPRWPRSPYRLVSPNSGQTFRRRTIRHQSGSPSSNELRSKSGGRLSRQPTFGANRDEKALGWGDSYERRRPWRLRTLSFSPNKSMPCTRRSSSSARNFTCAPALRRAIALRQGSSISPKSASATQQSWDGLRSRKFGNREARLTAPYSAIAFRR